MSTQQQTRHTPAPWERSHTHIFVGGEEGANVCTVGSPLASKFAEHRELRIGDPDFDESIANAEFIVRAVNCHDTLLAALANTTFWLEWYINEYGDRDGGAATAKDARAAIALAKEQPK